MNKCFDEENRILNNKILNNIITWYGSLTVETFIKKVQTVLYQLTSEPSGLYRVRVDLMIYGFDYFT